MNHIARTRSTPFRAAVAALALLVLLHLGAIGSPAGHEGLDCEDPAAGFASLGGKAPVPGLPKAACFRMAFKSHPDGKGIFTATCFAKASMDDVKAAFIINPGKGIKILEQPRRLRGWLKRGQIFTFEIKAWISLEAPRPTGLNVEMRYVYPTETARAYVTADPHRVYDWFTKQGTLDRLNDFDAEGEKVLTADQSLLFE